MTKRIIIIGSHPLGADLTRQYEHRGDTVCRQQALALEGIVVNAFDELCLLAGDGEDHRAIALLGDIAAAYDPADHQGAKMTCHLMVQSADVLQMLKTSDFCDAVRAKLDVYPFTTDEVWARSIVPDYEPVTMQSDRYVHLVIAGMDETAQTVAIQAALVAHYPNYVRNHALRTRITMLDSQAGQKSEAFISRYQALFDNSYHRLVNPSAEKAVVRLHRPMYEGRREDFVDVEWEFVEATPGDAEVRAKLERWARDERQLLSVVLTDGDADRNRSSALLLPQALYDRHIPIYIYGSTPAMYDVTLPLVSMAKTVNYIYDRCYEENDAQWNGRMRHAVEIDWEERERSWACLSNVKRTSSLCNAMTIPAKMRSLGLEADEWGAFYDISQQDIDLMGQVEHNRWSVEELILGFRPCTDEEQAEIEADVRTQKPLFKARKIHYDLRAYRELQPDGTGKPVQVYDLCLISCLPLIAKAFADEMKSTVKREL